MSKIKTKVYSLGKKRKLTLAAHSQPIFNNELRLIRIALAIRNPEDEYKKDIGVTIATNRLLHNKVDFSQFRMIIEPTKKGLIKYVSKETMVSYMDVCADIVKNNIDLYV